MRPSPKKAENCLCEFWLSRDGCHARRDVPVIWWGRNLAIGFLDNINLFFPTFSIYVCLCFVRNVGVSAWKASVWLIISCDYSDWMTAISMNADRPLWTVSISVWLSSVLPHISVWLLTRAAGTKNTVDHCLFMLNTTCDFNNALVNAESRHYRQQKIDDKYFCCRVVVWSHMTSCNSLQYCGLTSVAL